MGEILTSAEAAARIGMSGSAIRKASQRGDLPLLRTVGSFLLFDSDDVDRFALTHRPATGKGRIQALESIIRELYSCIENPDPIGHYLSCHQAIAADVIARGEHAGEDADGQDAPDDEDQAVDEDQAEAELEEAPTRRPTPAGHTCDVCDTTVPTARGLAVHRALRHGDRKDGEHRPPAVRSPIPSPSALTRHYRCSEADCGEILDSSGALIGHCRAEHDRRPHLEEMRPIDEAAA